MITGPSQPATPHAFYHSVSLEVIAAVCNGTKHYSNRVGAIHPCALTVPQPTDTLVSCDRVSAIKHMLFYYRHITIFVFFLLSRIRVFLVIAMYA